MFKSFFNSMIPTPSEVHLRDGFHTESPVVQQKREEAKQRMKELNRVSILANGPFSLNPTVLRTVYK